MILVTGGCGFIGSNFVLDWFRVENEPVLVLDKLTYAGNLANLSSAPTKFLTFIHGDIADKTLVNSLIFTHKPRAILNFAAESHVDRSIHQPDSFIQTNINGTFTLLEVARDYWNQLNEEEKKAFRYLQISTDEVYGSLNPQDPPFCEESAYSPNNPYSASKAAADHLVKAYHHTYGLPTLITNCSNNYGPYQFPEKLIPLTILNILANKPLLIYGDGQQIRDWLYVSDHCAAIRTVLTHGRLGETYNIGGSCEKTNLDLVNVICQAFDELHPQDKPYSSLITHIQDRPGHDRRYAINSSKLTQEMNWQPKETFASGIQKTISWYLKNLDWVNQNQSNIHHQQWLKIQYQEKLI